ncbi:MAG: HD domain-containing protein [Patescibacteria group bacterium]|nr:HD domain-containing protein [Patescibacteria group bacterium]
MSEEHYILFRETEAHPQLAFLRAVREQIPEAEWFLVGGAVRDVMLGRVDDRQDFDLVVRGVDLDTVAEALGKMGKVDFVGRDFGVLKFRSADAPRGAPAVDIAWPRTERSGGTGSRRDFSVQSDPDLPMIDDLSRRDFTVNAMAWDFARQELLDPFSGTSDLDARLIRAVREPGERFREDLSRMLRAIRFACQLGFAIEAGTWKAIGRYAGEIDGVRKLDDGSNEMLVPYETVAKEFAKALKADAMKAVGLLERSGMLFRIVPEFERMAKTEQSPEWHSEGDVWTHVKLALEKATGPEFRDYFPDDELTVETMFTILLHDVGKPDMMTEKEGKLSFYGHDVQGARMARSIAERLRLSSVLGMNIRPERIEWLVRNHLFPVFVDLEHVRKTTLWRYFLEDKEAGRQLLHVSFADLSASEPEAGEADASRLRSIMDAIDGLERQAMEESEKPQRVMTGTDVMQTTGIEAGPEIGRLLEELREAQLSGAISSGDDAQALLKRLADKG